MYNENDCISKCSLVGASLDSRIQNILNFEKNQKEGKTMSIAYVQSFTDGIAMLADSRNTYLNRGLISYSDDCEKIVYSKKYKMSLVQTGVNNFNGKSLSEIFVLLEEKTDNLDDFISAINKEISFCCNASNDISSLCYGFYVNDFEGKLFPEILAVSISSSGEIRETIHSRSTRTRWMSGVTWAREFLLENDFSDTYSNSKDGIITIKDQMQKLIDFSIANAKYNKSFIGGEVKALLLHPDGTAEWV